MPTDTGPRLPAARSVDSPTARTPAVYPTEPKAAAQAYPAVVSPAVVRDAPDEFRPAPSPVLTDDPGVDVEPYPAEWATSSLSPRAQHLHGDCCDWGGDVEGHGGVDYEQEAARERAEILREALDAGEVAHPGAVKAPVEAKVVAGAWSTLAAAVVLALSTAGLQQIDTVRALIGDNPWSGPAVLAVGVVLTAAQSWAAYQAPHTPRSTAAAPSR